MREPVKVPKFTVHRNDRSATRERFHSERNRPTRPLSVSETRRGEIGLISISWSGRPLRFVLTPKNDREWGGGLTANAWSDHEIRRLGLSENETRKPKKTWSTRKVVHAQTRLL